MNRVFLDKPLLDEGQLALLRAALGDHGLRTLLSDLPGAIEAKYRRLTAAFASGDVAEGRHVAAALGGVASNFGAARLATMSHKVARDASSTEAMAQLDGALSSTIESTLVALELELGDALGNDEFELWYQPWINLGSGRVAGCEALLRWRHPVRGLVGPMQFVSVAEETGLIARLGDWVMRRACEDAAGWPRDIRLAINLSAAQTDRRELRTTVQRALAETGFDAGRLELEIADILQNKDSSVFEAALADIRADGVRVVLDRFGSSHSSLQHIRRFSCDRIKIDRSLVANVVGDPRSAGIVSALVALGRDIGIAVTAEGVETPEQLAFLRSVGCAEAQGYLFSKPCSGAEMTELLGSRQLCEAGLA